jgi:hypothetical protein
MWGNRDKGLSMPSSVAMLALLFTYVEFIPIVTVEQFVSALFTAVGVGVIVYTGLSRM